MKLNKKGSISQGTIEKYMIIFLLIVVLFKVVATLIPTAMDAGDELNASGRESATFYGNVIDKIAKLSGKANPYYMVC